MRSTITALCLVLGSIAVTAASSAQRGGRYQDPIPESTVDPVISPMVYQGGMVVARVDVAADGSVRGVQVVKPVAALTDPIVTAVKQWRFSAARLDGRPVAATATVAVHVVLVRTGMEAREDAEAAKHAASIVLGPGDRAHAARLRAR